MPDIIQLTVVNPTPAITALRVNEGPPGRDGSDGASTAAEVSIADTGGNFDATTVEDALAELAEALPGSGDVVGPSSVTDSRPALFDGETGKLLKQASAALGTAAFAATGDFDAAGAATAAQAAAVQRANHTGTQAISTVTGLQATLDAKALATDLTSHTGNTSNPHSVTKAQVGLTNVTDHAQLKASDLDTDTTLAANSDTKIPSQKAVKAYVDENAGASTAADVTISDAGSQYDATEVEGALQEAAGRIAALEGITPPSPTNSGLFSGGGVAFSTGLTVVVSAATYGIQGTAYSSAETSLTADTADPTNPRIDVVAVNTSGTAVLIKGTAAATPVKPDVDPTTQLELTFFIVGAGATALTVNKVIVYDENNDYTMSESGTSITLDSTNNPHAGTKCIEGTSVAAGDYFQAQTASGTIDLGDYDNLVFFIRNKTGAWAANKQLTLTARNAGTQVGSSITFKNGLFGFSTANITTYQQIVIPASLFAANGQAIDQLRWACAGSGAAIPGFYVDDISLEGGLAPLIDATRMKWRGEWDSTLLYNLNDAVKRHGGAYVSLQSGTNKDPLTQSAYWEVLGNNGIKHFMWSFNPKAVCDGTIDRLFLMTVGPDFPNGIKITRWNVSFDADPTTEADLDFKRADAFIGVASAAVIDVLDTTNGASSETTAANINSDAAVANGKVLYLEFGTAYTTDNLQIIFEFWGYAV